MNVVSCDAEQVELNNMDIPVIALHVRKVFCFEVLEVNAMRKLNEQTKLTQCVKCNKS